MRQGCSSTGRTGGDPCREVARIRDARRARHGVRCQPCQARGAMRFHARRRRAAMPSKPSENRTIVAGSGTAGGRPPTAMKSSRPALTLICLQIEVPEPVSGCDPTTFDVARRQCGGPIQGIEDIHGSPVDQVDFIGGDDLADHLRRRFRARHARTGGAEVRVTSSTGARVDRSRRCVGHG